MSDLAERLDAAAREATDAVDFLPNELGARVRERQRKWRRLSGAVAAALVLAASLYVATSQPEGQQKIQVGGAPSAPSTTVPPPEVWAQLGQIARAVAAQFGDPTPLTGQAVATGMTAFNLETPEPPGSTTPDQNIYFIVLTGHFYCVFACFVTNGSVPAENALNVAVDRTSLSVVATGLSPAAFGLQRFGSVHQLDLSETTSPSSPATSTNTVFVPMLVGRSQVEAAQDLISQGLVPTYEGASSAVLPVGDVVATLPQAGSVVVKGSTVTLFVSSFPPATSTT